MSISEVIRNIGKNATDYGRWHLFDARHKEEALKAVHVIERYNSQKFTRGMKKLADEYSIEVLGSRKYAPWLYVYTLARGQFLEGWIPDNFFGKLVCPKINKNLGSITSYKSFSKRILHDNNIPDIGYYIDGIFYGADYSISSLHELREDVFASRSEVIVKKDRSGRGVGIVRLSPDEFNEATFREIGNCVIQTLVNQHEFFDEIIPGSVATVRITTTKEKSGRIRARAAYLRLGRKDTSWVQSDNSVRVAIVDDNGTLDSFGYTQDWRRWTTHPDSDFRFENKLIPKFKEASEACIELHNKVPHFTVVGWDVAVGHDEEINILEWNGSHCDIKFSEAVTGPCFVGLDWERYRE
ncbi:MAG: sugar-transfer associated ATP-grasp domain-containing protein [Alphaproteobacteria bacterium]